MELTCEGRGQLEVGVITHDGRVFAAFGSSVNGHDVTAYTRKRHGQIVLTRWDGSELFGCRTNTVRAAPCQDPRVRRRVRNRDPG